MKNRKYAGSFLMLSALVMTAAGAPAVGVSRGNIKLLDTLPPPEVNLCLQSVSFKQEGFPAYSHSFMSIENPAKPRPLFISGTEKRGWLKMTFNDDGGVMASYDVKTSGTPIIEYDTYCATPAGDVESYAASQLIQGDRPKIRMTVKQISDSKETTGNQMKEIFSFSVPGAAEVRYKDFRRPQKPVFTAKADVELTVNDKTVSLKKQPCTMRFWSIDLGGKWEARYVWRGVIQVTSSIKGSQLGLTGADAGPLKLTLVTGGHAHTIAMKEGGKAADPGAKLLPGQKATKKEESVGPSLKEALDDDIDL